MALATRTVDPDALSEEQQEGVALLVRAETLSITDQASFDAAAALRRGIKDLIARIEGLFGPIKKREYDTWKSTVATEKEWLEGPQAALAAVNKTMAAFESEQLRAKRLAEQRAADEAKVAAEVAKRDGVALPPMVVPAAPVPYAKVEGVGFPVHYKATVGDLDALIQAVAAGKVRSSVLAPMAAVLDDMARQYGPQTGARDTAGEKFPMPGVPGVFVVSERRTRG